MKHLLKLYGVSRIPCRLSARLITSQRYVSSKTEQSRRAGRLPHQAHEIQPGQVEEKSPLSKTYTIWAIAGLFVAIGALKQFNDSGEKKIFDPPRFTPFQIVKREEVSPTSIILTLRPQNLNSKDGIDTSDPYEKEWERGTWSLEVKQPQLQISRRYTPLPPTADTVTSDLRFLIRKEYKGEMSGYLHTLPVGADVGLRGPHTEYTLPDTVNNIVFLAAGTGIAPALQVAYAVLEKRDSGKERAKIHIIWANRRREDCEGGSDSLVTSTLTTETKGRIVTQLDDLQRKFPNQIKVEYLVDEEGQYLDKKRIAQSVTLPTIPPTNTSTDIQTAPNLIMLSGPDGFITYCAGPKRWEGGKETQGPLSGILGRMSLKDWIVWKL
jgi:cytochrome-b5 reductase